MPNVDSSGKLGRSMDYSMYLKRKRHNVLTSGYTLKIADGNPMFGRDKKTRGFDNGIVTVLFEKGLIVGTRSGRPFSGTYTANYIIGGDDENQLLIAAGLTLDFLTAFAIYNDALNTTYPGTPIDPTLLSYIQSVAPFTQTATNNTESETGTLTIVGNPVTDKAAVDSYTPVPANNGDSMTVTFAFG
jgi:hypothetical protein